MKESNSCYAENKGGESRYGESSLNCVPFLTGGDVRSKVGDKSLAFFLVGSMNL